MPAPLRAPIIPFRLPALLTSLCLGMAAVHAHALAIGDMRALSSAGEPFRVELDLVDLGGVRLSDIRIQVASAEDHVRLGLTPPPVSGPMSVQVLPAGPGALARVSVPGWSPDQQTPSLLLQLSWPGGLRLQQVLMTMPGAEARQPSLPEAPVLPQVTLVDAPTVVTQLPPTQSVTEMPSAQVIQIDHRRIRVESGDTLTSLAEHWRVQGLSLSQRKQLLAEANPQIFHYGDVRQLRSGSVAVLPAGSEMRRLPSIAQADDWVQRHESGQARIARPFDPAAAVAGAGAVNAMEPKPPMPGPVRQPSEQTVALTLVSPGGQPTLAEASEALKSAVDEQDELAARNAALTRRLQQLKQEAADRQLQLKVLDERLSALSQPQPVHPLMRLPPWHQFSTIMLVFLAAGFALAIMLARWRNAKPALVRQGVPVFPSPPGPTAPRMPPPPARIASDPDEDEYDFLSDAQVEAFQTRLDLARAYIDMGETEAARELLHAVSAGGSPAQREDARQLLKSTA